MSEDFTNIEKKPGQKKELALSVVILFVVILAIVAFVLSREYGDALRSAVSDYTQREVEDVVETEEKEEDVYVEGVEEEREVYKKVAKEGEGVTHLARRAINDYLQEEIAPEKKIYMEDYVQKKVAPSGSWLDTGEEVEISKEIIDEALEKAEDLSPEELQNLEKYAVLVFS